MYQKEKKQLTVQTNARPKKQRQNIIQGIRFTNPFVNNLIIVVIVVIVIIVIVISISLGLEKRERGEGWEFSF